MYCSNVIIFGILSDSTDFLNQNTFPTYICMIADRIKVTYIQLIMGGGVVFAKLAQNKYKQLCSTNKYFQGIFD